MEAQRQPSAYHAHHVPFSAQDRLPDMESQLHHVISDSRSFPINLFPFVKGNDPAKKKFIPKLQEHILGRFLARSFDGDSYGDVTDEDRNSIHIVNNRIYSVKLLRVNYTTYDVRRDHDTMNPRTNADIMVRSSETLASAHPYWYARILGVFHLKAYHTGPEAADMSVRNFEVLWVRWYGVDPEHRYGAKRKRLPKIGFVPENDEFAFGFLDPSLVIRGCHLIPSFIDGRTDRLLSTTAPTAARKLGETDDWMNYYVNIFVDRDMYMRHRGDGIGHVSTQFQPPTQSVPDKTPGSGDERAMAPDAATQPVPEDAGLEEDEEPTAPDAPDTVEAANVDIDRLNDDSSDEEMADDNEEEPAGLGEDDLGANDGDGSDDEDDGYGSM